MEYYQVIRNIREDMDIKQYQLAEMVGVSKKAYNLYENGFRNMPLNVLDKVLITLDVSLDYILGLTTIKKYNNIGKMNIDNIPYNLKKLRKSIGISQDVFASKVGLNQQTISEYERGNSLIPLDNLKRICLVNNISADAITGKIEWEMFNNK